MAEWTPPTAAEFKVRFPAFVGVADATITMILDEAVGEVPDTWGNDRTPGVLYLAAHLGAEQGLTDDASAGHGGVAVTGAVKSRTVGDVTTVFAGVGGASATNPAAFSRYGSTIYGQRYWALMRRHTPTIFVV